MSTEADFYDAMRTEGMAPIDPGVIRGDGLLHRYRAEGDRRANGWFVLHDDRAPAGIFGHWRLGIEPVKWYSHQGWPNRGQRERLRVDFDDARKAREQQTRLGYANAQREAAELWKHARAADRSHTYLQHKRVQPHGIRQVGVALLVPMRDESGALWNIQRIFADGSKRFLKGGRVAGLYHCLGRYDGAIIIGEGYATCASVHESQHCATACALSCGNLLTVAKMLRRKYPDAQITLAADNDLNTPGNPGLTKATEAARAIGALLAVPPIAGDFNDFKLKERAA